MFPTLFHNVFLTLIDVYTTDETILDNISLPEGVDKQNFTDNLLFRFGTLPMVYTNPNHVKKFVELWSKRRLSIWEKLYKTTQLEYDPIENYNRQEEYTDTRNTDNTGTDKRTTSNTENGTINRGVKTEVKNTYTDNTDNTNQATAYNSNDLKTTGKVTTDASGNADYTTQNSGQDTTENTGNGTDNRELDLHETEELKHTAHLFGNIGVTTSQQMIKEEREVVQFDIMEYIMDEFAKQFLILVY